MSLAGGSSCRSRTKTILINAKINLSNTRLRKPFSLFFNPISAFIIDPGLTICIRILPPVGDIVPLGDVVIANMISLFFLPMKLIHRILPKDDTECARQNAKNNVMLALGNQCRCPSFHPPSDVESAIRATFAILSSAMVEIVNAVNNPRKYKSWRKAMSYFNAFLDETGVGVELGNALATPMRQGRLLTNMKILNDIQEKAIVQRYYSAKKPCSEQEINDNIKKGKRMMRFATAAYGREMIISAIDRAAYDSDVENAKKAISFHTGIPEDDIKFHCAEHGGDMTVLRHFIAIDRETKSIVLAIRGTLSVSDVLFDMQAMNCEYCTGWAHKGIAEMASHLWLKVGDFINNLFEQDEFKDYGLTITGHSLGAGTACLLHIKCHVEKLVGSRPVLCFGFAPPPVFCNSSLSDECTASVQAAFDTCVCYINDNDCVPFLSLSSIRRLARALQAVERMTRDMWFTKQFQIFWELVKTPVLLEQAVENVSGKRLARVKGECRMLIPAKSVIWMDDELAAINCCPYKLTQLDIFIAQDMITDHLPEMYEDALDALDALIT